MRISDWSSDVCSSDLPHVLAAQRFLVAEPERLHRIERELRNVELQQCPFREAVILERVGIVFGLGEVPIGELALVGDDQPAELQRLDIGLERSEEHTSELQSLMRISYAVFCLKKKKDRLLYCIYTTHVIDTITLHTNIQ